MESRHTNMCKIRLSLIFVIVNSAGQNIKVNSSEEAKRQNKLKYVVNGKSYQQYYDRDYGKPNKSCMKYNIKKCKKKLI